MGWTYRQLVTGACQRAEGWVGHTGDDATTDRSPLKHNMINMT